MVKLGMKTNEMLVSSAFVISRRTHMIDRAMSGNLSWFDPEFSLLWQEKMAAGVESFNSLSRSISKQSLVPNADSFGEGLKMLSSSMSPCHKKAKANAKRLRKKRSV